MQITKTKVTTYRCDSLDELITTLMTLRNNTEKLNIKIKTNPTLSISTMDKEMYLYSFDVIVEKEDDNE